MARDDLLWAGTNRGALTIERQLTPSTLNSYEPTILLADPKENRAAQLGEVLRNKLPTLKPQALKMRVQDALAVNSNLSAAILTVDTLDATTEALNARRPSQRMTFQICGKGPGGVTGTLIGLQGTIIPGDELTERSVSLVLGTLAQMSRAASSRELTGPDRVTAAVLQPLRSLVSRQTARHLEENENGRAPWDLSGGPLSVAFGHTLLPLLAVEAGSQEQKFSQQAALALEMAGRLPVNAVFARSQSTAIVVVALVQARAVHFIRVALTRTGTRRVAGISSFVAPAPQRASSSAAVFTD
jgi:hypothetical protein